MRIIHLVLGLFIWCSAWGQRLIPIGSGLASGNIWCSTVYDGKVVIGGQFTEFNGQPCNRLIGWDGANDYETFPGLFTDSLTLPRALVEFQGDLIATGNMNGGTRVMRWDGTSWTAMGGFFAGAVREFVVRDGQLIAGGSFTGVDGAPIKRVAVWDGSDWNSLGNGFADQVNALAVHHDTLFAGGQFRNSGDGATDLERIAFWTGVDWSPLSSGLNGNVTDLMSTPNGLWISGDFTYDMDSTVAVSRVCSHNGSAYVGFPLPPMPYGAALFHSDQFGNGLSDGASTWFGDGSNFQKAGCWNIERIESLNGGEYAEGRVLRTDGGVDQNVGRLLPGNSNVTSDIAGVRFGLSPNNGFYFDPRGRPNYTIPSEGNASTVFSMSPCAAGTVSGQLLASGPSYPTQGLNGFWPGPTCSDTTTSYLENYLQAWTIDKGMIWDHMDHWDDPGYAVPHDIASWPGNGDVANGEPEMLSPFNDIDQDGEYEPEQGESPLIRGDREVHFILSSRYPQLNWPSPTGLDLSVTAFAFQATAADTLWQTTFLNLKYVNRSGLTYDTLYLGFAADFDIGCWNDDYTGCDTTLGLAFNYNANPSDLTCTGLPGFGQHPPAFGISVLNTELHSFSYIGQNISNHTSPNTPPELFNRLRGFWNNGDTIRSGCSDDPQLPPTRYTFPSEVQDLSGISEFTCISAPSDRRFISSYGPFLNVAPGDTICLEFALIFAQDTLGDNFTSVSLLKQKAAAVKAWYDQSGLSCTQDVALGMPTTARPLGSLLSIAPNPATDLARITLGATAGGELRVLTPTGQVIRSQRYAAHTTALELDLAGLPNGTYLLQTVEPKEIRCGRLVVLH
jgi:hypothetical protein